MNATDAGRATRMELEIYLMLHTRLEMREILRMSRRTLDWWVTSTQYLIGKPARARTKRRRVDMAAV